MSSAPHRWSTSTAAWVLTLFVAVHAQLATARADVSDEELERIYCGTGGAGLADATDADTPHLGLAPGGRVYFSGLPPAHCAGDPPGTNNCISRRIVIDVAEALRENVSFLRVDRLEPAVPSAARIACGRLKSNVARYVLELPGDVTYGTILELRVYGPVPAALVPRERELLRVARAAITETYAIERPNLRWRVLEHSGLRTAFVRARAAPGGELRAAADRALEALACAARQWSCPGAPPAPAGGCELEDALDDYPGADAVCDEIRTFRAEIDANLDALTALRTAELAPFFVRQPVVSPQVPDGYRDVWGRAFWLAAPDTQFQRLLQVHQVPVVATNDRILRAAYDAGDVDERLTGEQEVAAVLEGVPAGTRLSSSVENRASGDDVDPAARLVQIALTVASHMVSGGGSAVAMATAEPCPSPPPPLPFVAAPAATRVRVTCHRDDQGHLVPRIELAHAVRLQADVPSAHPLGTRAYYLGRLAEGREIALRVCRGPECGDDAGDDLRNELSVHIEPFAAFVILASIGIVWPATYEQRFIAEGVTGPDQLFRVQERHRDPAPAISFTIGSRVGDLVFLGVGASVYMDGYDALHHWFGAIGLRAPGVSTATYLMLSVGAAFRDEVTGYHDGESVFVPRPASSTAAAPTQPVGTTVVPTIGLSLAFDIAAVGDAGQKLLAAGGDE